MDKDQFLDRAKENLEAAEILYDNGLYNASANRAYYAAYHVVISFLLSKGHKPAYKHQKDFKYFVNEYINKKKSFSVSTKFLIYNLQEIRGNSDYGKEITKQDAEN